MYAKIAMDVVALGAQTTGFVMWPLLEKDKSPTELVIIPVTLFLVSCGYWENYVNKHSLFGRENCTIFMKSILRDIKLIENCCLHLQAS